jgi:hypothetical protein
MGSRLYFLSPLEIGMSLGIPGLYGFGEGKIRPCPVAVPIFDVLKI